MPSAAHVPIFQNHLPGSGNGSGGGTGGSGTSTAMPTGNVVSNGTTWTPTYSQDFTTDAAVGSVQSVYNSMGYYDGFSDTSKQGMNTPAKVLSVHDSMLDFYLHSENGQPLMATVMPDGYAPHTHGRFSMRYKTTASGNGYKFVGMYWPSSNDWNEGEIDWPEADLTQTPRPANAVPGTYNSSTQKMTFIPSTEVYAASDSSDWHVSTTEWTANSIAWYWDGALVTSVNTGIPTQPMRVTLQAETFINEGTVPTASSGHVLVDWIVIYDPAS